MNRPNDPPIHPTTHPPIHLSKGGSVSTDPKSSNRIELSRLDQILLKFLWFHIFRPTNPPIHPPTHQPKNTHPWVGNSPQIPNLQTESKYLDSFKSYCVFTNLGGYPPWGVGGLVGGGGVGWGHPHTHAHAHACMRMHAHAHTHACMLNMINMAAFMVAAICNFLTCLSSRFICVRACTCMCTCLGTLPMPPDAPQPICPLPRAAGSPNHQKFLSPELIEIIRFCLKNLYLWTFLNSSRHTLITLDTLHPPAPPPGAEEAEILKTL